MCIGKDSSHEVWIIGGRAEMASRIVESVLQDKEAELKNLRGAALKDKLKSGRMLYKATALDEPAISSAEQPTNEGSSLSSSSSDKGLDNTVDVKGNVVENAVVDKIEDYGEKILYEIEEGDVPVFEEHQRAAGEFAVELVRGCGIDVVLDEKDVRAALMNDEKKEYLCTRAGEVYGFVKSGKVYLDVKLLNPNTPVHEYTHL